MMLQLDFDGSDFIGVYGRISDSYGVFGPRVPDTSIEELEEGLGIKAVKMTIAYVGVIGSMLAMNSNGIFVNRFINAEEEKKLKDLGLNVGYTVLNMNAAGNIVLVNDRRALVHPGVPKRMVEEMGDIFGVEVVAENTGFRNVGMAFALTNKGVLCHPDVTDEMMKRIEELFGVKGTWGTVNHGMPFVGCGLVCNSRGVAIGERTTRIEMTRIQDALDF
jgi:translation initiation factor 6